MRMHALLMLTVGLLIAADSRNDAATKEMKNLAGNYVMVSGESKAEKLSDERIKEATLVIEGDKYTAHFGNEVIKGTLKVDPTKSPKEVNATDPAGNILLGIYKFEKGEFTVCFAPPGKERPKEFSVKTGTGDFIHIWKKKAKE